MTATPFLILSTQRCGTNLLRGLLNAHPRIRCVEEVFRDGYRFEDLVVDSAHRAADAAAARRDRDTAPGDFLERWVFRDRSGRRDVCGFKLFYEHAGDGKVADVWDWLAARPDVRVFHLWRRNDLRRHLSLLRAERSSVWYSTEPVWLDEPPVHVEPTAFLAAAERVKRNRAAAMERFARHAVLDIAYEDMVERWPETADRVWSFLAVEAQPAVQTVFRQNAGSLRQAIENYDELAAALRDTPHHACFDGPRERWLAEGRRRVLLPPALAAPILAVGRITAADQAGLQRWRAHCEALGVGAFHLFLPRDESLRARVETLFADTALTVEVAEPDDARLTRLLCSHAGRWVVMADGGDLLELPYGGLASTIRALRLFGAGALQSNLILRHPATPNRGWPDVRHRRPALLLASGDIVVRDGLCHSPGWLTADQCPVHAVIHRFDRTAGETGLRPMRCDRASLFGAGLLRRPDARQRLQGALFTRLRHARFHPEDAAQQRKVRARVRLLSALMAPGPAVPDQLDAPLDHLVGPPLRIALVTFEIGGASGSGGIGTAAAALAESLAAAGHHVAILYAAVLERPEPPPDVAAFWAAKGVAFAIGRWPESLPLHFDLTMFRGLDSAPWLTEGDFDVIHYSDALAIGALCLTARRQGLLFQRTQMVVTAHGCALWHNAANGFPITDQILRMIHAERQAMAGCDHLLAPSSYMLDWLRQDGVALPASSAVIPNVLRWAHRIPGGNRPRRPVQDLVFFGRLEPRKGLDLFCDALDRLHADGLAGVRVTFLGSPSQVGALTSRKHISRRAARWQVPWRVVDGLASEDALRLLRGGGVLAVVPSLVDNSPYTVLECLGLDIPLLTTTVGGIPELIALEDRADVLAAPEPDALAAALARCLAEGARSARPAASPYDVELRMLAWHGAIAARPTRLPGPHVAAVPLVSVCLVAEGPHIQPCLRSLLDQKGVAFELRTAGVADAASPRVAPENSGLTAWHEPVAAQAGVPATANALAAGAAAEWLLFCRPTVVAHDRLLRAMVGAGTATQADAVVAGLTVAIGEPGNGLPPVATIHPRLGPLWLGASENLYGGPCFLVRRTAFERLGGFCREPVADGVEHWDLLNRLALAGGIVEAVPMPLYRYHPQPGYDGTIQPSPDQAAFCLERFLSRAPRDSRDLVRRQQRWPMEADNQVALAVEAWSRPTADQALPIEPAAAAEQLGVARGWYADGWCAGRLQIVLRLARPADGLVIEGWAPPHLGGDLRLAVSVAGGTPRHHEVATDTIWCLPVALTGKAGEMLTLVITADRDFVPPPPDVRRISFLLRRLEVVAVPGV